MSAPRFKSILIIRPSALGDVCRSVPLAASLRRAFPSARIEWLVEDAFAPAIEAHPAIDAVVPFARRAWARPWRPAAARGLARFLRELGRRGYDLVVDAQGLARSGLFAACTGAGVRVGFADAREGAWLAVNRRVAVPEGTHAVDRMLALLGAIDVEPVPDARLHLRPGDVEGWRTERDRLAAEAGGDAAASYVLLAPASRWPTKEWPIERWGAVAAALAGAGRTVILSGSPAETDRTGAARRAALDAGAPASLVVDAGGRTTVGTTLAAIAAATSVVASDSAPLHMAVGFERPCVGLFGPTDPEVVGPWRRPDAVVQAWRPDAGAPWPRYRDRALGDRCMRPITVDMVLERLERQERDAVPDERARAGAGTGASGA